MRIQGLGLGFWVWGSGFRVQDLGFRLLSLGFKVWGLGLRVPCLDSLRLRKKKVLTAVTMGGAVSYERGTLRRTSWTRGPHQTTQRNQAFPENPKSQGRNPLKKPTLNPKPQGREMTPAAARHHARPFVGASQRRSWSHCVVLGPILGAFIAQN